MLLPWLNARLRRLEGYGITSEQKRVILTGGSRFRLVRTSRMATITAR
jgi:hypothetical protein